MTIEETPQKHSTYLPRTSRNQMLKQCNTNNCDTPGQILRQLFYKKPTVELAKYLLGKTLVRVMDDGNVVSGTIVETEAYLGVADAACHCYGGRKTAKTEAMFMPPGTAYVYNIYFQYCCFNISSNGEKKFRTKYLVTSLTLSNYVSTVCTCDFAKMGHN